MADEKKKEMAEKLTAYGRDKVEKVIRPMLQDVFLATPEDPVQFMIDWLNEYRERGGPPPREESKPTEDLAPPPDHLQQLPVIHEKPEAGKYNRSRRRAGVSAEPVEVMDSEDVPDVIIPKSEADIQHIRDAISHNILFSSLAVDELKVVIDAMEPKEYKAGSTIIKQGEDGNHFYVLDKGVCECFVSVKGQKPVLVKTYTYGESFGELALMYNTPRAATIVAKTDVKVWAMGRLTFRKVLMNTTSEKRKKYEDFLQRVPILSSLDKYERAKVADALMDEYFEDGACIIAQGDRGNNLYFVREGAARAVKVLPGSSEAQEVKRYGPGDYFGELALLDDQPRQASVYAVGPTVCVSLDRLSVQRLLGPCEELMKRNVVNYQAADKRAMARRRGAVSAEPTQAAERLEFKKVVVPKTREQEAQIRRAVSNNILFSSLDREQMQIIVDAMFEKRYKPGEYIIRQGDDGDHFYVLDEGVCECYVKRGDTPPAMVKVYNHGESFGELALMYNTPRAASIMAKTDVKVWAMDRGTFKHILMDTTSRKRKLYEEFLSRVRVLSALDNYERSKVADALESVTFQDGEYIIRQGEVGDMFYIVEKGTAIATKKLPGDQHETEVMRYKEGDFFGELALIHDTPRQANVIAVGEVTCVRLDRASFNRLLGPCESIIKRSRSVYEEMEKRLQDQRSERSESDA